MNITNNVQFNKNEAVELVLENQTTPPITGTEVAGQKYYNSTLNTEFYFNGTMWIPLTGDIVVVMGNDDTITTTTYTNIVGLDMNILANETYYFKATIFFGTSNTGRGKAFSISSLNSSLTTLAYKSEYSNTATSKTINEGLTAVGLPSSSDTTCASSTGNIAVVEGFIKSSVDDIISISSRVQNAGVTLTINSGSHIKYKRVL